MNRILTLILTLLLVVLGLLALRKSNPDQDDAPDTSRATAEQDSVRRFWTIYRQATADRLAGRLEVAAEGYRQAIQLNDQHEDGLYYLGNVYVALDSFQEAESSWLRLIELNGNSARTLSQLGSLYLCLEDRSRFDLDAAEKAFQRAHEINREETGPLLRLGEVALLRGDWSEATRYFEAVTGSNYSSVEAYFFGGFAAWKNRNPEKAAEWLRQAAHYTKNTKPRDNIVGEGDTRIVQGEAASLNCPLFETQLQKIESYGEQASSHDVSAIYRAVEMYLIQQTDSTKEP